MKKLFCFAVTGILAISSSLVCLADEEETTEYNIFEQVDTISTEIVTSVEQATDILSKYIATTTDYTGEVFDTLVENAVNLWQNSYNTALEVAYVTAGGAIDYVVKVSTDLGNAISDYINGAYGNASTNGYLLSYSGGSWYVLPAGATVYNGDRYLANKSDYDVYVTALPSNGWIIASYHSGCKVRFWFYQFDSGSMTTNSSYNGLGYYAVRGAGSFSSINVVSARWNTNDTAGALSALFGSPIQEPDTATNTPTNIITSAGIGSVNWSNVGGDKTTVNNEYNNIENTYNYVSGGYNTAEIETYGAEAGLSYLESAYDNLNEVPDVDYNYNFIQAVYFAIPTKIKAIIGLSLTMAMIVMLLGFKSGGLTK